MLAPWNRHHDGPKFDSEELAVGDSVLPPSRFGAGYTAGAATTQGTAAVTRHAAAPNPSVERTNRLAVASFVLTLLFGPFMVPATVPMALAARAQNKHSGEGGTAMANAALIVSAVYALLGVVVVILAVLVVR
ncbi:hypothetical protein DVS77_18485 [Mycolicibacterium moriokaense]|nr:hypothetical protein DVS77_18485 [Mycolicibacterium moriokaense]